MSNPSADRAYAHATQRVTALNTAVGLAIYTLVAASVWRDGRALAWVGGTVAVLVPMNIGISILLVKRSVRGAEALRVVVNVSCGLLFSHAIGWPLPIWLFLPFLALTQVEFNRRVVWTSLVAFWIPLDAAALYDGVPWTIPAAFTLLAVCCRFALDIRLRIIREMFERSDEQLRALDAAHVSLRSEIVARERAEVDLRHAQKLEAVGRLSAGIAHEINTPLQFVTNNVEYVAEATTELLAFIERAANTDTFRSLSRREASEITELRTGVPAAVHATLEGVKRITSIVSAMKMFAAPETEAKSTLCLDQAVTLMLAVTKHEYMYVADVVTELESVPPVMCHAGELGQVLLSLMVNAAHAIGEVAPRGKKKGQITIRTKRDGDHVVISIADNGTGIPEGVRDRVFEPFFTTRAGRGGTGQGLALARAIVVERHGGSLRFETEVGRGTTFFVRLPIVAPALDHPEAA
jgi:signal transduction histidine kinase